MRISGHITSLSAVTATGAGTALGADGRRNLSMQIDASSVSTGGTLVLEGTLDDSTWCPLKPVSSAMTGLAMSNRVLTVSATGTYIVHYTNKCVLKIRANLTGRTDGTYTVKIRASADY